MLTKCQGRVQKAIRAETPHPTPGPGHGLKSLGSELHSWQIITQQASTCYSPSQRAPYTPCPVVPIDKHSLHPWSWPSRPIRLRRAWVEAQNCPGRNETHRQNVIQGEERQMYIWFGCEKKYKILAVEQLYQCRDHQAWGNKEWIISGGESSAAVLPLKHLTRLTLTVHPNQAGKGERDSMGTSEEGHKPSKRPGSYGHLKLVHAPSGIVFPIVHMAHKLISQKPFAFSRGKLCLLAPKTVGKIAKDINVTLQFE